MSVVVAGDCFSCRRATGENAEDGRALVHSDAIESVDDVRLNERSEGEFGESWASGDDVAA